MKDISFFWTAIKRSIPFVLLCGIGLLIWMRVWWHQNQSEEITAWGTLLYSGATILTVAVLIIGGSFAYGQLEEIARARRLSFLLEMWKYYARDEMYDAVTTVWNVPREIFADESDEKNYQWMQKQRRKVSSFWHMIGSAAQIDPGLKSLIHRRFWDAPRIWENLKGIEIDTRTKIKLRDFKKDNNGCDPTPEELEKVKVDATKEVEKSSAEWVYLDWMIEKAEKDIICLPDGSPQRKSLSDSKAVLEDQKKKLEELQ